MRALFLTRTPFQAFLAERIAEQDHARDFDVVHVCTHATKKDESYYLRLTKRARHGLFFRHLGSRVGGYLNAIRAYPEWLRGAHYDRVYVSAYHAWYFRVLMAKGIEFRTFDDGSANYTRGTEHFSKFHDKLLCRILGGVPLEDVKSRTTGHYAVRPDLVNIMPKEVIIGLDIGIRTGAGKIPLTIAIGQPFSDYLSPHALERIRNRLDGLPYFPHPREDAPNGAIDSPLILEDYVAEQSVEHEITLVGGFSTALITISKVRKIYLDADGDARRRAVMEASGCEVETL